MISSLWAFARQLLAQLLALTYIRYGIVSVLALGLDMASLMGLHLVGVASWQASALAYMIGAVLHWELSVRYVFPKPKDRDDYIKKLLQYIGAGACGVVITSATIYVAVDWLELSLLLSKAIAVLIVFNMVYAVRLFLMKYAASK